MVSGGWIPCSVNNMIKLPKFHFYLIPLLMMALPLSACAKQYSAEPIEAWVVDTETGQPIEGVIVVAHWELKGGLEGGNVMGQMMVMESVTDKKGRFHFPAWGPKWHLGWGSLEDSDPELILFKSSYKLIAVSNSPYRRPITYSRPKSTEAKRISLWNGQTIKMERFKGELKEYAQHLSTMDTYLSFSYSGEDCEWTQTPYMIAAFLEEEERFQQRNISNSLTTIDELPDQEKCGSAKKFLKSYLQ